MEEIVLVRAIDGSFCPSSVHDSEMASKYKLGQAIKFTAVRQSPRSLKHHQKYFAGLLKMSFEYWEPRGGLLTPTERQTLKKFGSYLGKHGGNEYALQRAADAFLNDLEESRSKHIETPTKSFTAFHSWVKMEAGYHELQDTPTGVRKVAKSINFNSMSQEDFNDFYKAAFDVCWKFVLSRSFNNEMEAEEAINKLLAMG